MNRYSKSRGLSHYVNRLYIIFLAFRFIQHQSFQWKELFYWRYSFFKVKVSHLWIDKRQKWSTFFDKKFDKMFKIMYCFFLTFRIQTSSSVKLKKKLTFYLTHKFFVIKCLFYLSMFSVFTLSWRRHVVTKNVSSVRVIYYTDFVLYRLFNHKPTILFGLKYMIILKKIFCNFFFFS